jgi:hypothetical protein
MTAAIATVAVPMFVSAAVKHGAVPPPSLSTTSEAGTALNPERPVRAPEGRVTRNESSTDLLITGSSRRVAGNRRPATKARWKRP